MDLIFNDCQKESCSYKKCCAELNRLQYQSQRLRDPECILAAEQKFVFAFIKYLNLVLAAKKSDDWADRVFKFIVSFIQYSYQKCAQDNHRESHGRFMEFLIKYLLEGLDSKEKFVRARLCQLLACCSNNVEEISNELYMNYRMKMSERLLDKEWTVRVQAVYAISRFQGDSTTGVADAFLELLQYDPSADVRKAILISLEPCESNFHGILQRLRDVDPVIRRLVYRQKLPEYAFATISDEDKEWILHNGFAERNENVRKACFELVFGNWIKQLGNNLVELLLQFNIVNNEDLATDLLKGYYSLVPNAFDKFEDLYFENLSPETALIIRTYCEFVSEKSNGSTESSQALLPEISKMLYYIDLYTGKIPSSNEDEKTVLYFILNQLIMMARLFDYSDEVGRRNSIVMFKSMLSNPSVSEQLIDNIVLTMKKIAENEESLTQSIIEVICDFRDIFGIFASDEESLGDAVHQEVQIMAYARTLDIIKALLKLAHLSLEDNPSLFGLMNEVIIPGVNSRYAVLQLLGLDCLGLICILHKPFAAQYTGLLIEFFNRGSADSKLSSLKILFDFIVFYDGKSSSRSPEIKNTEDSLIFTHDCLSAVTSALYNPVTDIQAAAVEGFSKLFLMKIIDDEQILEALLFLYFHPSTRENNRCRQVLSFFIQAFSSNCSENQKAIAKISVNLLTSLIPLLENTENADFLKLQSVVNQLVLWTDSSILFDAGESLSRPQDAHLVIACEIYERAFQLPEHLKLLSTFLMKLKLTGVSDKSKISLLLSKTGQLLKLTADKATVNNIKKFAGQLIELEGA